MRLLGLIDQFYSVGTWEFKESLMLKSLVFVAAGVLAATAGVSHASPITLTGSTVSYQVTSTPGNGNASGSVVAGAGTDADYPYTHLDFDFNAGVDQDIFQISVNEGNGWCTLAATCATAGTPTTITLSNLLFSGGSLASIHFLVNPLNMVVSSIAADAVTFMFNEPSLFTTTTGQIVLSAQFVGSDVPVGVTPLPGAALLFGSALLGGGLLRRKNRVSNDAEAAT